MSLPSIITIDGPAASGKSTIGRKLAEQIGYLFIDTGVMYRAVTWAAMQRKLPLKVEDLVSRLAREIEIDIRPPTKSDGRDYDILADGDDVTWPIRGPEVEANVSLVSSYLGVRQALSTQQRRIGLRGNVVMAGRDIGTVVLPEAGVKIYLNASVDERAKRRYRELIERGIQADFEEIKTAMLARDRFDSSREHAPLRPARDAVIIDTDHLTMQAVLERVIQIVQETGTPDE